MGDQEVIQQIEEILEEIRPNIQMDGGDIEFVKFENGTVSLRLHGACVGCPAAMYTLKLGIEEELKQRIPDVVEVIAVE